MEQRFSRNVPAISPEQQALLRTKRAAIIGCGGLGGYIAEFLARAGLGGITVCDGDNFEYSNLNRQCLALPNTLGTNKALAAAERIKAIDSSIDVRCFEENLNTDNAEDILSHADIVMDGLDSISARLLLEDSCAKSGLVLIHGAVELWSAQVCASLPGSRTLHSLYADVHRHSSKSVLSHVPPLCAAMQCALALKFLLGVASEEDKGLFVLDSQSMDSVCMKL